MLNFILAIGAILYVFLQCLGYVLHLPEKLMEARGLAYAATVTLQCIRGLAYFYDLSWFPRKFMLRRMDKPFLADTTIVFIVFLAIALPITYGSNVFYHDHAQPILLSMSAVEGVLGVWLLGLSLQRSKIPMLIYVAASIAFALPLIALALVFVGVYKFLDVQGEREMEFLFTSAMIPVMVTVGVISMKNKRDRLEHMRGIIVWQLVALPAVPLVFMLLRQLYPANWSAVYPVAAVCGLSMIYIFALRMRAKAPWLLKERIAELARLAPETNLMELQADLREVVAELESDKLPLKDAKDYTDKADAYRLLGELQTNMMQFDVAEKSLNRAVEIYNEALKLDPDNRVAISNKFMTVENLRVLAEKRF